jgi:hypothetical protein
MHKGALPFEHFCHVRAERLRTHKNQSEEDCDLQDSNTGHSSFFRICPGEEARKSGK